MATKSVKRIELRHKFGQTRGKNTSEEIWIQFFGEANKSLATSRILYRRHGKNDSGKTVFSAILSYEGTHILRQHPTISGNMMPTEFNKLITGFEEQGFTAGKLQKTSEHKGNGFFENFKIVQLTCDDPIEMELELPESFMTWAMAQASELAEKEDAD